MADALTVKIALTPEQRQQIAQATGRELETLELTPAEWTPAYRELWNGDAAPLRIGRSLVIKVTGTPFERSEGDLVIELEPGELAEGTAFGTGAHATTRLALELLEERMTPGDRVLDLGTGSGILALAAARLGACEVLALDLDPAAVAAAQRNVARSTLAGVVQVREGSIEAAAGPPYDLLLANIIAPVIRKLAPELARRVRPGGLLIVSGIIAARSLDVAAALCSEGLQLEEERAQRDWRALVLRRVEEKDAERQRAADLPNLTDGFENAFQAGRAAAFDIDGVTAGEEKEQGVKLRLI